MGRSLGLRASCRHEGRMSESSAAPGERRELDAGVLEALFQLLDAATLEAS